MSPSSEWAAINECKIPQIAGESGGKQLREFSFLSGTGGRVVAENKKLTGSRSRASVRMLKVFISVGSVSQFRIWHSAL